MNESNPFNSPPTDLDGSTEVRPLDTSGDGTGGLIPYKNPAALAAYYLAIVGLFPVIGIFASIPAFVLGIMGLRKRAQNPAVKGSVHAWIGILLGGFATLANLSCIGSIVFGLIAGASR
ncbi:hypothetical protein C5Y96_20865 [Blastopirellula marina]|uniref:DUF4190 domain-containing protein n=1 Tax=Blastopirellula marina TaxID=124 RepID=A0A2S8F198_9BACT|nr:MULTISPECIES: DUF4190 domain-containing protein [Pirellulaceae]PQO25910.1 hypothetical protein C5Y96_20865 [Blastopirellula marina]RCS44268.1 hypothetical protein DTL36_20910 [Bremerella cremea]